MEASELAKLRNIIHEQQQRSKRDMTLAQIAKEEILKFKSGQVWLNSLKSNYTKQRYVRGFIKYMTDTGYDPDELLRLKPSVLEMFSYVQEGKKLEDIDEHGAENLLEDYLANKFNGEDKKRIKDAVISFYKHNRRPLAHDVAEAVYQRRKSSSEYRMPTTTDLDQMAKACVEYRDSFLVWFLASTGMRRETATLVNFGDLKEMRVINNQLQPVPLLANEKQGELDRVVPVYVFVEGERLKGRYEGNEQQTFLHFEAYEHLEAYMKWLRHEGVIITHETPLFVQIRKPHTRINKCVPYGVVKDACVSAFGNGKTYSPHDLRRFNQTQLERAKTPDNWVKKIQGKKIPRQQAPYSLPSIADLHKAYNEAVAFLVPQTSEIPQQALARRINQQEQTINHQQETLNKFKQELPAIFETIKRMEQQAKARLDEAKREKEQLEQETKELKTKTEQQSQDIELLKNLLNQ